MYRKFFYTCLIVAFGFQSANAESIAADVEQLIESSCIGCHDGSSDNGLDFETLPQDLSDTKVALKWEQVFDRVQSGEMPPDSEVRPDAKLLKGALVSLKEKLTAASLNTQKYGRISARRLTKLELGYTLQDLLKINDDITSAIPDEVESGGFDVIGANQRISGVHIEAYLKTAEEALDRAIQTGPNPYRDFGDNADDNFSYLEPWHEKPLNEGGNITRPLKNSKGYVLFRDVDYLTAFALGISRSGTYRLSSKVAAYQSTQPVTAKFIVKGPTGGARLVKAVDLITDQPQTVVFETFMERGETPYLTFDDRIQGEMNIFFIGAKNFKGPGLAVTSQRIEGPLYSTWPPPSTSRILGGVDWQNATIDDIREVARRFAPDVFRRPVSDAEVEAFVKLAEPVLKEGRDGIAALKVMLRSMLSAPQFLLFGGSPGPLDNHALANRLSYFLWRTMPDHQLMQVADEGKLVDSDVLRSQTQRMLEHENAKRMVDDFVGQWLLLNKINVTVPDDGLYPEFDETLGDALPRETRLFFAHLIKENLSVANLIDSNFTFVNRRLAEHYGIDGVVGQEFRRVSLPEDSLRGGILTQAAVLKTTANGTTTSPVTRGNFVLTNFLGTPPSPPPPSVGSIEPDTRGQTTIREILAAHRDTESCNQCHRAIDPPGFALESFDPVGGYRTFYRATGGERTFGDYTVKLPYKRGPDVDPSGNTAAGKSFADIGEFKRHLLDDQDIVAKNFVSQLVMFSTGGEIKFADRDVIEQIMAESKPKDYPVGDLIHAVVQSRLFREK